MIQHSGISAPALSGIPVNARIGVIRNARSHRNRHQPQANPARAGVECVTPATRDDLGHDLANLAAKGIDVLIVDGGDGTMRDVLTHGAAVYGDDWPPIMILPKGKTNALAVDLEMPDALSLDAALAALPTARAVVRRPIRVQLLDSDTANGGDTGATGFIMGAGVFGAAIDAGQVAHRFGAFQGLAVGVAAGTAVLGALFGLGRSRWRAQSAMRLTHEASGAEVPHSGRAPAGTRYAAGFSTLGRFPLGMNPFGTYVSDIHYLVVDAPLRRVIARIPAILMGGDGPAYPALGIHRGASASLIADLGQSFILDGEAFPPGRYRLGLGPALTFLVP